MKATGRWLALSILGFCASVHAGEISINVGGGKQPDADQRNRTYGVDYSFYTFEKSDRQHLIVGVSLTRMRSTSTPGEEAYAVSVYPQLSLFARETSWIARHFPKFADPYFFVRALGPSYLSDTRLGSRNQARHFTFQAQVGVGFYFRIGESGRASLNISRKHFSNARLFSPNDGFDFPIVLSMGFEL